jgi:hypothetical protein
MICSEKYRLFVKYFINYLYDNNLYNLPKEIEQTFVIQEKVYNLIKILLIKNSEFKNFLNERFKFLKFIDFKCIDFLNFIECNLNINEKMFANKSIFCDNHDMLCKIMVNIFNIISNFSKYDLMMKRIIKIEYPNIVKLLALIYQNREDENVNFATEVVIPIFEDLFYRKNNA